MNIFFTLLPTLFLTWIMIGHAYWLQIAHQEMMVPQWRRVQLWEMLLLLVICWILGPTSYVIRLVID